MNTEITSKIELLSILRDLGFCGDYNNLEQIYTFIKAEYYSNKINAKSSASAKSPFSRCLEALKMDVPPQQLSTQQFFAGVTNKIKSRVIEEVNEKDLDKFLGGRSMMNHKLNSYQVEVIKRLIEHLNQEYKSRMLVLLKRLDVTIQSFNWSVRAVKNQDKIVNDYQQGRADMDKQMIDDVFNVSIKT